MWKVLSSKLPLLRGHVMFKLMKPSKMLIFLEGRERSFAMKISLLFCQMPTLIGRHLHMGGLVFYIFILCRFCCRSILGIFLMSCQNIFNLFENPITNLVDIYKKKKRQFQCLKLQVSPALRQFCLGLYLWICIYMLLIG